MKAVIFYTLFLFIITPFLPNIIQFASKYWPRASVAHFVLIIEIMIAFLLLIMSGWLFISYRSKFFPFLIGVSAIFIINFIIYQFLPNPYEYTHLPEYAILGFLLAKALIKNTKDPYLKSFLYATFIGIFDELYQGILPNRSFAWYDIILNAMGSVVGLLVFWGTQKNR